MDADTSQPPLSATVRLANRGLDSVPQSLMSACDTIRTLQLAGNKFSSIPDALADFHNLTDLGLASNKIENVSSSVIGHLSQLVSLSLSGNSLMSLPPEIGSLHSLRVLALGGNKMVSLPAEIGDCTSLCTLTLSENDLSDLPNEIGFLKALRTLRLDANPRLASLPERIYGLSSLEMLSASSCNLQALPERIGELGCLTVLQAKNNELRALPATIGDLKRLTTLGISGNRLRSVPSELSLCCSLRVLALSANRIEKLSCQMGSLRSLVELRLDDNPLVSLPDDLPPSLRLMGLSVCSKLAALPSCVGRLQNLCELAVGAARLEALPRSVSDLGRLQTLQLSGNTINSLPQDIGRMAALKTVEVSDNRIDTLPESMCSLPSLEVLRASENQIRRLPNAFGCLTSLLVCSFAANRLSELPHCIGSLTRLQVLDAASNFITAVPDSIGELTELRQLSLDNNLLSTLPSSLCALARCEELGLAFNALTDVPTKILGGHMTKLRRVRLHSNQLQLPLPECSQLMLHQDVLLFDNPSTPAIERRMNGAVSCRCSVALLIPGLVRNYEHGKHWSRFVHALSHRYDVHTFICVWSICGSVKNNFAQQSDRQKNARIDLQRLKASFPHGAHIELINPSGDTEGDIPNWIDQDAHGNDGRYLNQWNMVSRCWDLMERRFAATSADPTRQSRLPAYVIRARPDLRVACLPRALERDVPYLAIQDRLWGADAFFYGDYESMRMICQELAPRYYEYTSHLGHASSEPMLYEHMKRLRLLDRLDRFSRCVSVDRT